MSYPELTIRPYRPGDEQQILETFNLVFREVCGDSFVDRTMTEWRWQYHDNPMGHRISLAVAPDGTIVSQYAGVPVLADTPFGEQRFIHCVDSMTHPKWRKGLKRPGVFVITGWPFSAHSRRIQDAVLYGFPVDTAFRIGSRYLEYHFLRDIDYLTRDAGAGVFPAPSGVAIERVDAIPADIGALYAVMRAEKRLLLRRDYRYLDWRYRRNPQRADYELWTARALPDRRLIGFVVLKPKAGLAPDSATIADWLAAETDDRAIDALVHVATRRLLEEQKDLLMTVFPEWSSEWQALAARGFAKTPSATWLQRRLVYLITGSPLTADVLQRDWWYALGDSDLA
ncbi:MAG: hypothetical protein KDE27_12950 [Planctomycetes bacterium]|nr:hypothetical protein [Planctomycetota bacterium]